MTSPSISGNKVGGMARLSFVVPVWLKNPAGLLIIAAAFLGVLGTVTLVTEVGQPFGQYMSYGYMGQAQAEISRDTPSWWPPIATGLIQYPDYLATINNLPYLPNVRNEMARAYASSEVVLLELNRQGETAPIFIPLPVRRFTVLDFMDVKLPELLVGVAFWLLAVIVLRAGPDSETNQVFAAITSCVAIHRLTIVTSIFMDEQLFFNLPKVGHMMAAGLIGPLLIHLSFLFPNPSRKLPRKLLFVMYILGLLFGVTLALTRLPLWSRLPVQEQVILDRVAFLGMLYLLLGGIVSLFWRLVWSLVHWKQASRRERRIARILLLGLLISLPPVIIVLSPILPGTVNEKSPFIQALDLRYFMLAIPIAFALAILRYQTFRSPSPLFLSVIVMSLSAIIAALAVAIWSLPFFDSTALHRPPFVLFFSSIFLSSLFWSRQTDWRGWFGRYLNRTDRNFESARSFGNRVMGRNDLKVLPNLMAQALVDELELERAAIWTMDPATFTFNLVAAAGGQEPAVVSSIQAQEMLPSRAFQVVWPTTPEWIQEPAVRGKFEVLVPLAAEGRTIGLLGLGSRWDEEIFDERDLSIAELVGQQATLFMLAATQVEELRRVPGRVAEAQERERYRLASELHDTIQQLLGRLPFFLAVSRDMMGSDREGAAKLLDRCMDDVEDAARVLREIRANLAPNQLEISLSRPLSGLVHHIERQSGLKIHLQMPENLDESTNLGTRHALYRVIQQALDNSITHAAASEIVVTLDREDGRVLFRVADDGYGVTDSEIMAAQSRGSFGLQSMRARIETVGGEFGFTSTARQGTTVSGWVPAAHG